MRVLFLAPFPLYQARGSSIAATTLLRVLSERGDEVDVVTYQEGSDVSYNRVTIHRVPRLSFLTGIRPGFSWKKVVCDLFMLVAVLLLAHKRPYNIVHATEEAVFIALVLKMLFRMPYVYDMDSSLAQQLVEQVPALSPLRGLLNRFERLAVVHAEAVMPVCDALAKIAERHKPTKITVVHDVPLLPTDEARVTEDLRRLVGTTGQVFMYVGNLQPYQGIDLLLESFALALQQTDDLDLVIVGGEPQDIESYCAMARRLGIGQRTHFVGLRPVQHLEAYLAQADVLVSPRVKGNNTPMKIYSYLHSGKPLLATDLATHTQILDERVAVLAQPTPEAFAQGMLRLAQDPALRYSLGLAGKSLIEEKFSYLVFWNRVNGLFDWLTSEVGPEHDAAAA